MPGQHMPGQHTAAGAPAGPDEAALEAGRWLFAQSCAFVAGAATEAQLPPAGLPEVAFAGRSNVGKSSLINALTGRKTLARTSNTPGRTQQLNFFALGPEAAPRLMLVDLPGYGYAKAARKSVQAWTKLIHAYLRGRPNLRRLCLLVDARHGVKPNDEEIMNILDAAALSYQIVLTKADKVPPAQIERQKTQLAPLIKRHTACHPDVLPTSAVKADGIDNLRAELASFALTD